MHLSFLSVVPLGASATNQLHPGVLVLGEPLHVLPIYMASVSESRRHAFLGRPLFLPVKACLFMLDAGLRWLCPIHRQWYLLYAAFFSLTKFIIGDLVWSENHRNLIFIYSSFQLKRICFFGRRGRRVFFQPRSKIFSQICSFVVWRLCFCVKVGRSDWARALDSKALRKKKNPFTYFLFLVLSALVLSS